MYKMPSIMITWIPKACRTAAVRKEVAAAVLKALSTPEIAKLADIPPENIVVRFGEATDGFPLPKGFDIENCEIDISDEVKKS
mmetsp:Transcript_25734/g.31711  ORF Transcript_25734/g.31711 Transcript_25734/m.31711 type:complete len:83 (-) Transcript_25734:274-522(-)